MLFRTRDVALISLLIKNFDDLSAQITDVTTAVKLELHSAVVSVFPTTEGYTSSCKDEAFAKTEDGPEQELNYELNKRRRRRWDSRGA